MEASLLITGKVKNEDGVIHAMAQTVDAMPNLGVPAQVSHDYH
jgi:hypothetical protein